MAKMTDRLVAYVGERSLGNCHDLITLGGAKIGICILGKGWRIRYHLRARMYQIYACHDGIEWTGRGMGEGYRVILRPTKWQNLES
jgi:hypothetical protein